MEGKYEVVHSATKVIRRTSKYSQRIRARQRWYATGGIFGIVGGILFPVLTALFTRRTETLRNGNTHFGLLADWMTFAIVPLVGFGLWCLNRWVENSVPTKAPDQPLKPHPNLPDSVNRALVRDASAHRASARRSHFPVTAIVAFTLCCAAPATHAQQTIFNVPTTDVLERGKVYVELDVPFKPNDSDSVDRFSSFVPRIVVGAGGRTEVGLNVTGNIQPGRDQTTLVPTAKFKIYDGGANGFALVVGDNIFVPVRNRAYRLGNYVYLNGSKTIGKTRLTAGGYHFSDNVVAANAQRAGGQFGFEQTINPRLTFAADWITGKHASGYFTPGVIFKPTKSGKLTGYAAYSIGNTGVRNGNHFFLLEVGYNFD